MQRAIWAGNLLQDKPYRWGGGHQPYVSGRTASYQPEGFDCSGTVSFVLHAAGLLDAPRDSTGLMSFGQPGPGKWFEIYAHGSHAFIEIAGLRLDTSGSRARGGGPRWRKEDRSSDGYAVRHPEGL